MPKSNKKPAVDASTKVILDKIFILAQKRADIRKNANKIINHINHINRTDLVKDIDSPHIRTMTHQPAMEIFSSFTGQMAGSMAGIYVADKIKTDTNLLQTDFSQQVALGVSFLVGSALGFFANLKFTRESSWSLMSTENNLRKLHGDYQQAAQDIAALKQQLKR